jgi:hypothetical protein
MFSFMQKIYRIYQNQPGYFKDKNYVTYKNQITSMMKNLQKRITSIFLLGLRHMATNFMVGHLDPLGLYLKAALSPAASLHPTNPC